MAFRHYGGSPPPVRVAWKCPTCGVDNMGALEAGCTVCNAGADAKKAAPATTSDELLAVPDAFEAWWEVNERSLSRVPLYEAVRLAYQEGAARAREATPVRASSSSAPTEGGYLLAMVSPDSHDSTLTDQRTHATILAALAFYRDHQLAYGSMPGQLDAAEVSALITKLTPSEEPSA